MNKKTRLFIFFLGLGVVGIFFLFLSFRLGSSGRNAAGQCGRFGVQLTWQAISLEKFDDFWATKNGIDQKYCETNGGVWGAWSRAWQSCYCAMAAPDINKVCRNSNECLSRTCLYDASKVNSEIENTSGSCAGFKMQYPTPNCEFDRVENGKLVKKSCVK